MVLGCSCPQIFPRFGCGGCACSCAPSNPSSDMFAAVLSFLALISLLFPSHLTTTETLGTGGQKMASRIALSLSACPPCIRGSIKLSRQSVAYKRRQAWHRRSCASPGELITPTTGSGHSPAGAFVRIRTPSPPGRRIVWIRTRNLAGRPSVWSDSLEIASQLPEIAGRQA